MEEEKESLISAAIDRHSSERFGQGVAKSILRSAILLIRETNLVQRPTVSDPEKLIRSFQNINDKRPVRSDANRKARSIVSDSIC